MYGFKKDVIMRLMPLLAAYSTGTARGIGQREDPAAHCARPVSVRFGILASARTVLRAQLAVRNHAALPMCLRVAFAHLHGLGQLRRLSFVRCL